MPYRNAHNQVNHDWPGYDSMWLEARDKRVLKRDRLLYLYPQCFWCDRKLSYKTITFDHFIPKNWGGSDLMSNMVGSCHQCNVNKGQMLPCTGDLERLGHVPTLNSSRGRIMPELPTGLSCVDWITDAFFANPVRTANHLPSDVSETSTRRQPV